MAGIKLPTDFLSNERTAPMRGGDTSRLRAYNERLIMHVLLRAGALSKAEIARETGLSGQAASVIVNRLLAEGMLIKGDKVRGQVGQPSTPIAPNPEGAFSLGVKIGRRSSEVIVVNVLGDVIASAQQRFAAPLPETTLPVAVAQAREILDGLGAQARRRVVGLGVAMPGEIYAWSRELGLPEGALDGWRDVDVAGAFEAETGLDVSLHNDATAACAAEMIAGEAIRTRSALYIYLGTFIGGGVVIDGRLYPGEQLNAGAIGSMPASGSGRRPGQLIHSASVIRLERSLEAAGLVPSSVLATGEGEEANAIFDAFVDDAVADLSRAIVAALGVIDFETIVIDGLLPPAWRERIVARIAGGLDRFNRAGLAPAAIVAGTIGPMARVLGAAMLPLEACLSPHPDLLARTPTARSFRPQEAAAKAATL